MKKLTIIFALLLSSFSVAQTYKLYKTDNFHNQLKLNTRTGEVNQVQDDGQVFLVNKAVTPNNAKDNRYVLEKTKNMWTFILLDKFSGKLWQCQFSVKGTEYIFSQSINSIELSDSEENEFTIEAMTSMYQFYLISQKSGEIWMFQWSTKGAEYVWIKKL